MKTRKQNPKKDKTFGHTGIFSPDERRYMCVWKVLALPMTKKRLSTYSPSVHIMLHMYIWRRTMSRRKDRKRRDICKARSTKEKKRTSQQGFWFFQLTVQISKRNCILVVHVYLCSHIASLGYTNERKGSGACPAFWGQRPREQREERVSLFHLLFVPSAVPEPRVFEFGVAFFWR